MFKKLTIIFLLIFCSAIMNLSCHETHTNSNQLFVGFSVGTNGYTENEDITGGYYLNTNLNVINDYFLFRAGFNTNILANPYKDKILRADIFFNIFNTDDLSFLCLGPSYLLDLVEHQITNYVGLSLTPFSSWKSEFDDSMNLSMHFLPVSIMYGIESSEWLWSFSFISFEFYI